MRHFARLLFACALFAPSVLPAALPAARAGNSEALMKEWVAKKRQVRKEVFDSLQKQGVLPRDGSVTFTAVVKPDPEFPDKTRIYIERIDIAPASRAASGLTGGAAPGDADDAGDAGGPGGPEKIEGRAAATAMEQAFKPTPIPGAAILQSLDIPVGASLSDRLTVENGRLLAEELAPPDPVFPTAEPRPAPAPVEEKSWWDALLEYFKF